jgi:hypothetical protein
MALGIARQERMDNLGVRGIGGVHAVNAEKRPHRRETHERLAAANR